MSWGQLNEMPMSTQTLNTKWLLVPFAILVLVILFQLLSPQICGNSGPTMRGNTSRNNMRSVAVALFNYEIVNGRLPADIVDDDGKALLSWRVRLLPDIGRQELYDRFHLGEPWDSPHNLPLSKELVEEYTDRHPPVVDRRKAPMTTAFVAVRGAGTVWGGDKPQTEQISKGDFSILLAEMIGSGIVWTEPRDLDVRTMMFRLNAEGFSGIRGAYPEGANVAFTNQYVRFLDAKQTDEEFLRDLVFVRGTTERPEKKSPQWLKFRAEMN
jgi:hypothetical protein